MFNSRLMQCMLLDFYGELLTEKQRECFDLHYNEDLSLAEIAEQCGISRQGVWDNIRRAEQALNDIEQKTGLVARFSETQDSLDKINAGLNRLSGLTSDEAHEISLELIKEIEKLRSRG